MRLSSILSVISVVVFISGIIMIAMGWCFCLVFGSPTMIDTMIGVSFAALGALLILAAFRIAERVKKARRKMMSKGT